MSKELHDAIMNIPCKFVWLKSLEELAYHDGHRDARNAAAALAMDEPTGYITVEAAIVRLVESLQHSKGWTHAYADAIVRDAVDREPARELTDADIDDAWDYAMSAPGNDGWRARSRMFARAVLAAQGASK